MAERRRSRKSGARSTTRFGVARPIETPAALPKPRRFAAAAPQVSVVISPPGSLPVRAVLPAAEVTPAALERLRASARDLPRLATGPSEGAVDIRLDARDGSHVKSGTVVLADGNEPIRVPLDPTTRRFRIGGVRPGEYDVRGASAADGRASSRIVVREGDVTRASLRLDEPPAGGTATLRLDLRGEVAGTVRVRATDQVTGALVFDERVSVSDGTAAVRLPFGRLHFEIGEGAARSCYDADVNDLFEFVPPVLVEIVPPWQRPEVEPGPDWLTLPEQFTGMARVLPRLGVRSMDELAAAEPEALMHRALAAGDVSLDSRLLAAVIESARQHVGVAPMAGTVRTRLSLARGKRMSRRFRPAEAGTIRLDVNLGPGASGRVIATGLSAPVEATVRGRAQVEVPVSAADVEVGRVLEVAIENRSPRRAVGSLVAEVPGTLGGFATIPWARPVKGRIEAILSALAAQNPGLSPSVSDAVLAPENIRGWLNQARTLMHQVGVCSIDDLGRLRVDPSRALVPGALIAPVRRPSFEGAAVLPHYKLAEIIGGTVLHYRPNDLLHDTAIVLADDWDIRGQTVVIAKEVRELFVIVKSILHDAQSRITWEMPGLPPAQTYWPSPAPNGAHGGGWGADGAPGGDGDTNPHPTKNGGASAVTPAPIVTMYLLDTTNNLPPIDLGGQDGGSGGKGQDGGNGGNGHEGLRASGTFFGGCCRGVGWGGDGGRGGHGGKGGRGGSGGEGGKLTLLTTEPGIMVMEASPPLIDVNRGQAGAGGARGLPGIGGLGGPAGTADCETWCDEHPERHGDPGPPGNFGDLGDPGQPGPAPPSDAIQILPITEEEWNEAFNNPHILSINPAAAEPNDTVMLSGANFDPSLDHVFFDGQDLGAVDAATWASFSVPTDAEGGYHAVVVRPAAASERLSNKVMLQVLPKLDAIPGGTRWNEGDAVTLTGLAFRQGCQVLAEDWSTNPVTSFTLPTTSITRTQITLTIAQAPLANLRGVRRILVRNPDGGTSRDERVARIGDTIVVRCAAFRVVGQSTAVTTPHSAGQIASLFVEGGVGALTAPWSQARIAFELVQPVSDIIVADTWANVWPNDDPMDAWNAAMAATPFVPGALNILFVRDVEESTAYAWYGGGPLVVGDEPGSLGTLNPTDFMQVVAHEIGHALCLIHVCNVGDDPDGGFFGRNCQPGDEPHLMYPHWNVSDGMAIPQGQIDQARVGATNFERGKTQSLSNSELFQGKNPAQCQAVDLED